MKYENDIITLSKKDRKTYQIPLSGIPESVTEIGILDSSKGFNSAEGYGGVYYKGKGGKILAVLNKGYIVEQDGKLILASTDLYSNPVLNFGENGVIYYDPERGFRLWGKDTSVTIDGKVFSPDPNSKTKDKAQRNYAAFEVLEKDYFKKTGVGRLWIKDSVTGIGVNAFGKGDVLVDFTGTKSDADLSIKPGTKQISGDVKIVLKKEDPSITASHTYSEESGWSYEEIKGKSLQEGFKSEAILGEGIEWTSVTINGEELIKKEGESWPEAFRRQFQSSGGTITGKAQGISFSVPKNDKDKYQISSEKFKWTGTPEKGYYQPSSYAATSDGKQYTNRQGKWEWRQVQVKRKLLPGYKTRWRQVFVSSGGEVTGGEISGDEEPPATSGSLPERARVGSVLGREVMGFTPTKTPTPEIPSKTKDCPAGGCNGEEVGAGFIGN